MSRFTGRNARMKSRILAADLDPILRNDLLSLQRGYMSMRATCSMLHGDNNFLRTELLAAKHRIDTLESDLEAMRSDAESAYRRGYSAGGNGA